MSHWFRVNFGLDWRVHLWNVVASLVLCALFWWQYPDRVMVFLSGMVCGLLLFYVITLAAYALMRRAARAAGIDVEALDRAHRCVAPSAEQAAPAPAALPNPTKTP